MPQIDEMDRKILALLQRDARLSNAEIAQRVAASATSCRIPVVRSETT